MAYQYSTANNPPNSPDSKAALAKLIRRAKTSLVLNEHIDEPGDIVFRHACRLESRRHRIEAA